MVLLKSGSLFGGKKVQAAPRFPMFVNLYGQKAVIIGGGQIAARRAAVLLEFGAEITVIAPEIHPKLAACNIRAIYRPYAFGDCKGSALVLAATNSREINHAVYEEAKAFRLPVNISDAPEECSFYFPAIVRQGPLVIGLVADGKNHKLVKEAAQALRENTDQILWRKGQGDAKTKNTGWEPGK